jgi:hypothetical protein
VGQKPGAALHGPMGQALWPTRLVPSSPNNNHELDHRIYKFPNTRARTRCDTILRNFSAVGLLIVCAEIQYLITQRKLVILDEQLADLKELNQLLKDVRPDLDTKITTLEDIRH